VTSSGSILLSPPAVLPNSVGEKAFGLACLPPAWTLPFVVVSSQLLSIYRTATASDRATIVSGWAKTIQDAATAIGLKPHDPVLVRSSAVSESLEERGQYHSTSGTLFELESALDTCLSRLAADEDLGSAEVHLIVQQEIKTISAKGHLSNERRCYEEARDWLGESEDPQLEHASPFRVNLRKWRHEHLPATEAQPLICRLKPLLPKVLTIAAWWAYRQRLRVNFEWVWDGTRVFLVQADRAKPLAGVNPTTDPALRAQGPSTFTPRCLESITAAHAAKYQKIRNVLTYHRLGLPTTNLFVLDDPNILASVRTNSPPSALVADLAALARRSLVIRTDLATHDIDSRQLLPRTNELRNADDALTFLRETLNTLHSAGVSAQIAFIFHNFIPAVASAFAYAVPGQRKVRIEALWGLPEGLYYNSHDKFEVDTGSRDLSTIRPDRPYAFTVTKRPHFKRYFIAPDAHGQWVLKQILQPWDWRLCIRKPAWINQIAFDSRRIAEFEQQPVSVMWFIEVPSSVSRQPIFPWYHEPFDYGQLRSPSGRRRKTPFDRSCIIRTRDDIEQLRRETLAGQTRLREIRIQPREDALLRDKHLLKTIGELARRINAVILLEGGTLSHAYYQLKHTDAVVEVAHPFDFPDDVREFNKLVRDGIPARIQDGGEFVRAGQLTGDTLLRALREKLVEEAFEALDARHHDEIVDELADLEEVIDAILKQLKSRRSHLRSRQGAKRQRAGGFEKGYVLLDTSNPPPTASGARAGTLPLLPSVEATLAEVIPRAAHPASTSILAQWGDQREHGSASERLLNLVVSLVQQPWSAESREIPLGDEPDHVMRVRLRGKRVGSTLHLEVSIFAPPQQLGLLK
jgi:predicted house-cleaning noncanonical NTP pyrophosphatase (MazG superfamily)